MTWAVIMKRGQSWCHLSVTAKKTSFPGSPFVSLRVDTNLDGNGGKKGDPGNAVELSSAQWNREDTRSQSLEWSFVHSARNLFLVFMWRHCGHIGVQNNSEKNLLGLWLYHYAKLERRFAIVFYTNMAVSSREWKPRIPDVGLCSPIN